MSDRAKLEPGSYSELVELAKTYVAPIKCKGGSWIHPKYCCLWCGSIDPTKKCNRNYRP